jgi:hypothetical protein
MRALERNKFEQRRHVFNQTTIVGQLNPQKLIQREQVNLSFEKQIKKTSAKETIFKVINPSVAANLVQIMCQKYLRPEQIHQTHHFLSKTSSGYLSRGSRYEAQSLTHCRG